MAKYKHSRLTSSFYISVALLMIFAVHTQTVFAELPPAAYREMQKQAPEYLEIKVISVKIVEVTDGVNVEIKAQVTAVNRSKSQLTSGAAIQINYMHNTKLLIGPSPIPILKKGKTYPAFLKAVGKEVYGPAAMGRSFEVVK